MKRNKHMQLRGDIKDRGMVKWQGLMLPEHNQLLKEWYAEDEYDEKPRLDETDLEQIQDEINIAVQRKCEVRIKTWKENRFHFHKGVIQEMNSQEQYLLLEDPFGVERISAVQIVGILLTE